MSSMSNKSSVMIGEESAWGTAVARSLAISANNESLQLAEGLHVSGAMRGDAVESVSERALRDVTGGLSLEPNANDLGRLARGLFATRSSAALAGKLASAPGASLAAGGSLVADSAIKFKVSAVVEHDTDGEFSVLEASGEVTATPTGTDLTVALTWSAPASVPDRTTLVGFVVWATAAGGSSDTQKWLAYVDGAGTTSYNVTSLSALDTAAPYVPTIYRHVGSRGTGSLASFSVEVPKDNGSSELVTGLKFNSCNIGLQAEGPMTFDVDCIAKDLEDVTAGTPSHSLAAKPLMGHRSLVYFYDQGGTPAAFTYTQQVTLAIANNLNARRWLNNSRVITALKEGRQGVTGSFVREYEDINTLVDILDGQAKALRMETFSNPVANWEKEVTIDGETATVRPWRYQIGLYLPRVEFTSHQAPSSGADPIVQTAAFTALKDSSAGFPLQMEIHNLTASYS